MFDLGACYVERTEERDYRIHWRGSHPGQGIAVYVSNDPEYFYRSAEPGVPLLRTRDEVVLVRNPDKSERHYFYLESERGEGVILAERQVALEGTPNFRDLGGYETGEGRRLKWGKLYRSSKLSGLTAADVNYVRRLGLTLICDFRQLLEQELEPTRLGDENSHVMASLPVAPGSSHSFIENLHNGIIAVDDASSFMQEINRDFVANQMPQYAEMFQLLLLEDQQVLIHCASGKDRTGIGAALILDVLGVSEEAIVEDYLLTNKYLPLREEVERLAGQFTDHTGAAVTEEILRPLLEVRPEYIRACFEEIRARYRNKEHFYRTALNLDQRALEHLRDSYLE